jgi:formylglycine-generating enzyme required for sulfatase activity
MLQIKNLFRLIIYSCTIVLALACGGGGGGSSSRPTSTDVLISGSADDSTGLSKPKFKVSSANLKLSVLDLNTNRLLSSSNVSYDPTTGIYSVQIPKGTPISMSFTENGSTVLSRVLSATDTVSSTTKVVNLVTHLQGVRALKNMGDNSVTVDVALAAVNAELFSSSAPLEADLSITKLPQSMQVALLTFREAASDVQANASTLATLSTVLVEPTATFESHYTSTLRQNLSLADLSNSVSVTNDIGYRSSVRTIDGHVIPFDIYSSFKVIPEGNLSGIGVAFSNLYSSEDDADIADSVARTDYNSSVAISGFEMMETEVTVGMYVYFLNSAQGLIDQFGSSATTDTTSSFTFSTPKSLYRAAMSLSDYCGIIMTVNGVLLPFQITPGDLSGFYTQKPKQDSDVDPFVTFQKSRMTGTAAELITFEASPGRDHFPMCFITQTEAKQFCAWLGVNYRLPTVYEWMYAAKGGNPTADFGTSTGEMNPRSSDNTLITTSYLANIQGASRNQGGTKNLSSNQTLPNGYGLRDMSGSVYEWTYFSEEDSAGAIIPNNGLRYIMGGSYGSTKLSGASVWSRYAAGAESIFAADLGFRVLYSNSRAR